MIEKESGLYLFFQFCHRKNRWILTTGMTKDKKRRLGEYRTGLASIEFDFWIPTPILLLDDQETILQNSLKEIWPTWQNSKEQFEIGESLSDVEEAKTLLETFNIGFSKSTQLNEDEYLRGTLDGSKVIDTRAYRPMCAFIAKRPAQLTSSVDAPNKFRQFKTFLTPGKPDPLDYKVHSTEQSLDICQAIHQFNCLKIANEKHIQKLNTPLDNEFIK